MLFVPRIYFQNVGWPWSWEHSYQIRSGLSLWYFEWVPIWYALFRGIKAYWRFLREFVSIGSYVSGFICFIPALTYLLMCDRWLWRMLLKCPSSFNLSYLFHAKIFRSYFRQPSFSFTLIFLCICLFTLIYFLFVAKWLRPALKVFDILVSCVQVNSSRILCYCLDNIVMMKSMRNQMKDLNKLLQRIPRQTMRTR